MKLPAALAPLLVLAACSAGETPPGAAEAAEGAEHIACALGGDQKFTPVCAVERVQQDGRLVLVVRHPDGAFRRFDVLGGGQGLALSDGAETAAVSMQGKDLQVVVGLDRYRFPATAKAAPQSTGDAAKP